VVTTEEKLEREVGMCLKYEQCFFGGNEMLAVSNYQSLIVEPVREMLTRMVGYLPVLLGALAILTVGWVVAKTLRAMVNRGLKVAHFDSLAEKAGISQILAKGGLKTSAREVLSTLVYWLVIVMVLVVVVNALGLPQASRPILCPE
jgi:hypothetical protein